MSSHLVSVVVPTKNSSATLEACLQSVKDQTYQNIEIVIVDNFSEDTTAKIAQNFTRNFYEKGPERSIQRNFAVDNAHGVYVCIIDSDMELDPTVIAECVAGMESSNSVTGIVIPEESFGEGFWAQCKRLERSFYVGIPYMEAARFFRRNDFLKLGGYDTKMVSGEDWDLSQRIETLGSLGRTSAIIHHNEGKISLTKTVKKKFYYAQQFSSYLGGSTSGSKKSQQTSIVGRYLLFFSKPKKLFAKPLLGLGMLFMKTLEFVFGGVGLIISKLHGNKA